MERVPSVTYFNMLTNLSLSLSLSLSLPLQAMCVTAGAELMVVDTNNFRVQLFDIQGKFIRTWGSKGSGPSHMMFPRGGTVSYTGRVYVLHSLTV